MCGGVCVGRGCGNGGVVAGDLPEQRRHLNQCFFQFSAHTDNHTR